MAAGSRPGTDRQAWSTRSAMGDRAVSRLGDISAARRCRPDAANGDVANKIAPTFGSRRPGALPFPFYFADPLHLTSHSPGPETRTRAASEVASGRASYGACRCEGVNRRSFTPARSSRPCHCKAYSFPAKVSHLPSQRYRSADCPPILLWTRPQRSTALSPQDCTFWPGYRKPPILPQPMGGARPNRFQGLGRRDAESPPWRATPGSECQSRDTSLWYRRS